MILNQSNAWMLEIISVGTMETAMDSSVSMMSAKCVIQPTMPVVTTLRKAFALPMGLNASNVLPMAIAAMVRSVSKISVEIKVRSVSVIMIVPTAKSAWTTVAQPVAQELMIQPTRA